MNVFSASDDAIKDFRWSAKRDMPSPDDRTKNDPCFLMSSKKSFELIYNLAASAVNDQGSKAEVNIPSDIFKNKHLSEYTVKQLREVALEVGWSDVKVYNSQFFFISELFTPEPVAKSLFRTVIARPIIDGKCSINLNGWRFFNTNKTYTCKIVQAQTLDNDCEIETAPDNTLLIFSDKKNIASFNANIGVLYPNTNLPIILTMEYQAEE